MWIRTYWPEDDVWSFFEVDEELWPLRQVDLCGPGRRPMTAASRSELLWIRDHADLGAMAAYERQYGVLAEGDLMGWQTEDQACEITHEEFEQHWMSARHTLQGASLIEEGMSPDRARLIRILAGPTDACEPARAALRAGGDFTVGQSQSPADQLSDIYELRLEHTQERGIGTLGLGETVSILAGLGQAPVRMGQVHSPDKAWTFILFLSPDAAHLLACTGVQQRWREGD